MLVKTYCAAVNGLDVTTVTIEVSLTKGVMFRMTGLGDTAVREGRDRMAAALVNNGYLFPNADITVNMAPADLRKEGSGFTLSYLGDGQTDFQLELTYLHDRKEKYDLGECEFHLAFNVDDLPKWHERHEKMGCICFENKAMGIYFIEDPDGYWLEIVPIKK